MSSLRTGPLPTSSELPTSVLVALNDDTTFLAPRLLSGGTPWRLLRLNDASAAVVNSWRTPQPVTPRTRALARRLVSYGMAHVVANAPQSIDDIDVVVTAYNNVAHLEQSLASLSGFSLTVVDDASPGLEVERLVAAYGARYVRRARNGGPSAARNEGARATTRPFIWFLDADVRLSDARSTARRLVSAFVDPLVAVVAPRVVGEVGATSRERFEESHSPLDMGTTSGLVVPLTTRGYVPAAAVMVRRDAFGDGFDEILRVGEDVDFVWRLSDNGWLVCYDAETQVRHPARETLASWCAQRHAYGTSAADLALRHPDRLAPVRADGLTMAAWTSLLMGKPRWALAALALARRSFAAQLPTDVPDALRIARRVVTRGMAEAGLPLSRAVARTYLPLLVLALAVRPLRRPALVLLLAGTAARWRASGIPRPADLAWSLLDDASYSSGVWRGAARRGAWTAVTPHVSVPALARRRRPT